MGIIPVDEVTVDFGGGKVGVVEEGHFVGVGVLGKVRNDPLDV